jgi:hypothetical protein
MPSIRHIAVHIGIIEEAVDDKVGLLPADASLFAFTMLLFTEQGET